jgi:hypothetical protein
MRVHAANQWRNSEPIFDWVNISASYSFGPLVFFSRAPEFFSLARAPL